MLYTQTPSKSDSYSDTTTTVGTTNRKSIKLTVLHIQQTTKINLAFHHHKKLAPSRITRRHPPH